MPGTGAGFPVNFYPPATRVMLAPSISRYSEMPPNKWIWKNALKRVNYGFGNHSKPFTSECDSEPGWCGDPSNLCFSAMHGYEVYELQGLLILDPINPEEVESYKAEHARILKAKSISRSYRSEKRCIKKYGSSIWGTLTCSLVKNQEQTPSHILIYVENITGWKRMANMLQENE